MVGKKRITLINDEHVTTLESEMQSGRTFTVRIKRDPDSHWYAVRCVELPEAMSQGETEEEALNNIKEAIELVLEENEIEVKKAGGRMY